MPPQVYEVRLTEPAEVEIEVEYARLAEIVSPEYAERWQDSLIAQINTLSTFPARCEVAHEDDRYDVEVRRLLYHGPSQRSTAPYRILFYIVEPALEDEQGLVRILHTWHGARQV